MHSFSIAPISVHMEPAPKRGVPRRWRRPRRSRLRRPIQPVGQYSLPLWPLAVALLERPKEGLSKGPRLHKGTLLSDGSVLDISPGNAGRRLTREEFDPLSVAISTPIADVPSATERTHAWMQNPNRPLYDAKEFNCQRLANWIAYGVPDSPTVDAVEDAVKFMATAALVTGIAVWADRIDSGR